jgi:hypothetical protein
MSMKDTLTFLCRIIVLVFLKRGYQALLMAAKVVRFPDMSKKNPRFLSETGISFSRCLYVGNGGGRKPWRGSAHHLA